jgi:hypothetical protein
MANLNELIERRKQINEDIKYLKGMLEVGHEALEMLLSNNDYESMIFYVTANANLKAKLMIILEQNVTLEEAKAIIEAQKEQAV